MAAGGTDLADSLAALERLQRVETDGDARLRTVRGRIDLALSQLRADSDAQLQAAQRQADADAEALLIRGQQDADAEAARILADAKAALAQRAAAGPPDLTPVWADVLEVLFGELR